jgi:VanZ family protein
VNVLRGTLERSDYLAAAAIVVALPLALWLRARRPNAAQVVWIAALVAVSVPFEDLQSHTHWAKVAWIPFVSPPVKLADIVANVLLYMPLGWLQAEQPSMRRAIVRALLLGATLAILAELSQVYSHGRLPSMTDVVCDCAGAVLGAWLRERNAVASR